MCDPTECWIELPEFWSQAEFKGWLRSSLNPVAARLGEETWLSRSGDDDNWLNSGDEDWVTNWSRCNAEA